jgi:hypothetical protein
VHFIDINHPDYKGYFASHEDFLAFVKKLQEDLDRHEMAMLVIGKEKVVCVAVSNREVEQSLAEYVASRKE